MTCCPGHSLRDVRTPESQQTQPKHRNKACKLLCKLSDKADPGNPAAHPNGIEPPLTARLSRKSPMGGALAYIANHWDGLRVFLEDGRVEMDNNPVENLIRPLALNRKNALFCGHDEGGASWARSASLVETCKLNGVDPYAYLRDTLEAIAAGHPQSHLDDLLPWAFTPRRPNP